MGTEPLAAATTKSWQQLANARENPGWCGRFHKEVVAGL